MSTISKLRKGRDNWRNKAVERANTLRYFRKENNRIKKERDQYKKELKEVKKQLENSSKQSMSVLSEKKEIVYLTLQLFVIARISFQGIARVLKVIGPHLGLVKMPCPQTIINWVTRLSITRAFYPERLEIISHETQTLCSNKNIAIIDISATLGTGKILTALFLNIDHHLLNKEAPNLQDVNYAAVAVADSWTGETVANFLREIVKTVGKPAAYLKDGGTELAKAIRLLVDDGSPCIDDVSHVVANLLKHEYQEHPMFETFISTCSLISKEFKQTIVAIPPKASTKSRFMNLHRLVKWAEQLLKHSPKGRARNGSVLAKLRAKLDQMPICKAFINRFIRDANPLLACQKILKTKGLNQDTYKECQEILKTIPPRSAVHIGFTDWMEKHLLLATELDLNKTGMLISSDIIESLFGTAKQHGTNEVKDANRIALRIPAICGSLTMDNAINVLDISVKEQEEVEGKIPSLIKQRRKILPNPDHLDEILINDDKQNLVLIPRAKKQSKNKKVNIFQGITMN